MRRFLIISLLAYFNFAYTQVLAQGLPAGVTPSMIALKGVDALETRERLLEIESLIYGDKYNFVKDSYVQYLNFEINDGVNVEDDFLDDMDDFLIE